MSTRSVPNVRSLPPANIAPGAAGTHRQCTAPAVRRVPHPQRNRTRHAAPAGVAGTRLCVLSRQACNRHYFAHFLHQNDIFCALSVQNRPRTDRCRILLRESKPISCHEKRETFFKFWAQLGKTAHSIPYRYPVDTRLPKNSQPLCVTIGHSSATCGQNRPTSGRTAAYKQEPPEPLKGKSPAGADRPLNQRRCRHSRRRAE